MTDHSLPPSPKCIAAGVSPLVTELNEQVDVAHVANRDPRRAVVERFVRLAFRTAYAATVDTFCPRFLTFSSHGEIRAAVGYRDGGIKPLFSELYLDRPAEQMMRLRLDQPVERAQLVEVGNLALSHPGQARWIIAATTVYLRAAGYRWVLFTAVTPLVNAFKRLGLQPIPLVAADPRRLADQGAAWGSYYDGAPRVYAGDIEAGVAKLKTCPSLVHPKFKSLLDAARALGATTGHDVPALPECAGGAAR
jgi:hypothetical protein